MDVTQTTMTVEQSNPLIKGLDLSKLAGGEEEKVEDSQEVSDKVEDKVDEVSDKNETIEKK